MSKFRRSWLGLAAVVALVGAYELRLQAADAPPRAANGSGAALESYTAPDGETYFAMKLSPRVNPPKAEGHDVVVLFDTSASQTGLYREKALQSLDALLASLGARDRVALSAVDLNAVPLTSSFVAADSPEMKKALVDLRRRVPLGSTDMGGAVGSAVARFAESGDAGHVRSVVYIGDGVTTARVMTAKGMQKLVDALVEARASVSS
ncbi:MAG TPA: vWA domain-containing protein, partial [Pirellulales bacterium]|nr:vWA domain-containing protein [Pirellulales bacterium]